MIRRDGHFTPRLIEIMPQRVGRSGARFDISGFHSVVLTNGELPLTVLEELVRVDRRANLTGQGGIRASRRGYHRACVAPRIPMKTSTAPHRPCTPQAWVMGPSNEA